MVILETLERIIFRNRRIDSIPEIGQIVKQVENKLEDKGRVLVRYSGTEPVCRVMVEGENRENIQHYAKEIAGIIEKRLG